MFALGAFLEKNILKKHFSLIVFGKKIAQSPRNLALSVCRTTFPRFSDTSGGWATSMVDPSAARILDPLRRSWPLTKPPSAAYKLRMKGWFCWNCNALLLFSNCRLDVGFKTEICWNMLCCSFSWSTSIQLLQFQVPAVFQDVLGNLIGYSDLFKGGTNSSLHG